MTAVEFTQGLRTLRSRGLEISVELSGTFRRAGARPRYTVTLPEPVTLDFWRVKTGEDGALQLDTGDLFASLPWNALSQRHKKRKTGESFEPVICLRRWGRRSEIIRRGHVVLVGS